MVRTRLLDFRRFVSTELLIQVLVRMIIQPSAEPCVERPAISVPTPFSGRYSAYR